MQMSNDSSVKCEEFKLVTYKNKRKSRTSKEASNLLQDNFLGPNSFTKDSAIRRIQQAKFEIKSSDLFDSVAASLREGLLALENPSVKEIICFGLGKIGECTVPKYQLALLLCLKELYPVDIKVYDPVFTQTDYSILESFQCIILKDNIEGKYRVHDKNTTIFYLPHCPKQLSNNLLWANWGLNLNYTILIANSFNTIIENTPKRSLMKDAELIQKIVPYVLEFAVVNTFRFYEIFNDTAIHIFPWDKIKLLSDDFWSLCSEPVYSEDDLEFINKSKSDLELHC